MRSSLRFILLALLVTALPVVVFAQHAPPEWENLSFVTTSQLKKMFDEKADFLLINALSPTEHNEYSIAGSINAPYGHVKNGTYKLPADKSKKLIFYCKGPKCTKSKKTALLAIKQGYENVVVYDEGLPAWARRGLPTISKSKLPKIKIQEMQASALLKEIKETDGTLLLVDIRDSDDIKAGTIAGALHIPLVDLDTKWDTIPKDKKIVLIDLHGKQTKIAARFLTSKGFKNIRRLTGGFVGGWVHAQTGL